MGSGSEELNGTYDMMGNVWEWMESPYNDSGYGASSSRGIRGGAFYSISLLSSYRDTYAPTGEHYFVGFRVASVPEPGSISLLVCGLAAGLIWFRRKR